MTSARIGKPGVAIVVGFAVPLELIAGGAQPHTEIQVQQPSYVNVSGPAISGSNVAAQTVDHRFEPIASGPTPPKVIFAPTFDNFFTAAAHSLPPGYDLSPHDRKFLRADEHRSVFHPRGHMIRGGC